MYLNPSTRNCIFVMYMGYISISDASDTINMGLQIPEKTIHIQYP